MQDAHQDQGLWYKLLSVRSSKDLQERSGKERKFITVDAHTLLISTGQGGSLIIDGRYHLLHVGAVYICSPGQLLEVLFTGSMEHALIILRFEIIQLLPDEEGSGRHVRVNSFPVTGEATIVPASLAVQLGLSVYDSWSRELPSERLWCEAGFIELLALVLRQKEQTAAYALEEARRELERHSHEETTIAGLARIAGLSRFHFMRQFKDKYGMGVMDYRAAVRLQKAKELMTANPAGSVSDIAYKVGYSNEHYFSIIFKKHTGMAPAVYMRRRSIKVAAYSWVNIGQLLPLQVIPYAAPVDQYWSDHYRTRYKYEVRVPLSHQYDFNRGELQKAEPDYILGIDGLFPREEQERLADIAPALFLPWNASWRSHLQSTASFLKLESEAEYWLRKYERKSASVRDILKGLYDDKTLLLLTLTQGRLYTCGRRAGTVLYDDLLFGTPDLIREVDWKLEVTLAQLAECQAGRILLNIDGDERSQSAWRILSGEKEWKELEPVKTGKLHLTVDCPWLECPWNEYSAYHFGRFLGHIPRLFGLK
ncbi:hypothetical protein A3842_10340 [Paenibacillus sp. P3E]|uniref:AraC family transcriptional regulator n=1 Tax=Paenibacillus sp. P3E TaxID=1349435 RepID=UPI0009388A21|nr:helix-turn-helix domain-containing protein [Paenibacillus sp. P3E]OKP82412.1 hypothetical protein A3842_10340 [Paenibacillus sp. P3E]